MGDQHTVTVLHVSDTQFGRQHRFGAEGVTVGDRRLSSLAGRLLADLRHMSDKYDLAPDLIVASGDLTETGMPAEFNEVHDFLAELGEGLGLERRRMVMVPGNHDVNWLKCRAYFLNCEGEGTEAVEPFWPKFEPFAAMFNRFYSGLPDVAFPKDQPWSYFEIEPLKTVVAGLNSVMMESHRQEDHYGYCGEEQLRSLAERLAKRRREGWLRIGVVHHNPVIASREDDSSLRDADMFTEVLAPHLNVLMHGHTHQGKIYTTGADGLPVLCAGSTAVSQAARADDVPNQYQIVRITSKGLEVHARRYNPSGFRWEADTSIGREPEESVRRIDHPFKQVEAAFPARDGAHDDMRAGDGSRGRVLAMGGDSRLSRPGDDLVERVERVCKVQRQSAWVEVVATTNMAAVRCLRVTESGEAQVTRQFPIGVVAGELTPAAIAEFEKFDARHRIGDPNLTSYLVYEGAPAAQELVAAQARRGIHLQTLLEFQGVPSLDGYATRQQELLLDDATYPPGLYVPQSFSLVSGRGRREAGGTDLLAQLREWITEHDGRFIVVLGDFGFGKTFLLRELTRVVHEDKQPPVVPVLIQLRELEKAHTLEQLLAAHLTAGGEEVINHRKLRFLIEEGRVLLLFDGFDELALRVTYERAAEHLTELVRAAQGRAKVVLTSRTQHFLSDQQVETALGLRMSDVAGRRLVKLVQFTDPQILEFLTNLLAGDETAAATRFALIRDVRDLLGLSRNPRMLSFIAQLDEARLIRARDREGSISAASLYYELLAQWLGYEQARSEPPGALPTLTDTERWRAVTELALLLWNTGQKTLGLADLDGVVTRKLTDLAGRQLTSDQASQLIGSGTLLVRTDDHCFGFVHRSVMEWLVANAAAEILRANRDPEVLAVRPLSELMADFLTSLAGSERTIEWARSRLTEPLTQAPEPAKKNALLLLRRLRESLQGASGDRRLELSGLDLRGEELTGADLRAANLHGTDLTDARLDGADLSDADLSGASLVRCSARGTRFIRTDLRDADLSQARLFDADLREADLTGIRLTRAVLLGADLGTAVISPTATRGAALSASALSSVQIAARSSSIEDLAWSPDGDLLATVVGGVVTLQDPITGGYLRTLTGNMGPLRSVCFSPDGRLLASGGDDGVVRLWDPAFGEVISALTGHTDTVWSVCFSPDGRLLASGGDDGVVRLWDPASGEVVSTLTGHRGAVWSVCFSPDRRLLATGSNDGDVRLWDPASGQTTKTLTGHLDWVRSVCFSPDGDLLATGSDDGDVRLWDPASGQTTKTLTGRTDWVWSVCFSPDGRLLATGGNDGTVLLWDPVSAEIIRTLTGHIRSVRSVCFSPDGRLLATGSDDGDVRLWDPASGQSTKTLTGRTDWVRSVCFSPDGRLLVTGGNDGVVRLWDSTCGEIISTLAGGTRSVWSVCFSPDGRLLASGGDDGVVRLWDPASGGIINTLTGDTGTVWSVCFSPDGRLLATGSSDGVVRLCDPVSGEVISALTGDTGTVWSVCFSPDGDLLASGGDDGVVRLWDPASGEIVSTLTGHTRIVWSVCFSPDGRLLATGSSDGVVRLCDPVSGEVISALTNDTGSVWSVCFSPDGDLLASGDSDGVVRLWDPASGEVISALTGHAGSMWSVCFSPDGRLLASGGDDGTVRLWDPGTGVQYATLLGLVDGWAAFSPTGFTYKYHGTPDGEFLWSVGLCPFGPGELDRYYPQLRQLSPGSLLADLS